MRHRFDGDTLVLPEWKFSGGDPRVPHRSKVLAACRLGDKVHAYVQTNQPHSLFWVHVVGPGFAGDRCRRSHTVTTRNARLAEQWIQAVKAGKVKIETFMT